MYRFAVHNESIGREILLTATELARHCHVRRPGGVPFQKARIRVGAVRGLRDQRGLGQSQLAAAAGMTQSAVSVTPRPDVA